MSSLGLLTSAVGSVLGALTNLFMILVIGLFIAVEPRLYERGVAWMLPSEQPRPLLPHLGPDGLRRCGG